MIPFGVGDKVRPNQLFDWTYTGLKGKPDKERDAVRRYRKGQWIIEVRAHSDRSRLARVMSVRTIAQDDAYWHLQRQSRINGVPQE
jgi:hypothetical protein